MPRGGELSSSEIKWRKQKILPATCCLLHGNPGEETDRLPFCLCLAQPQLPPECQAGVMRHCRCGGQRCGSFGAGAEGRYLCQSAQGQVPVGLRPPLPRRGLGQDHGVLLPPRPNGVISREPEQRETGLKGLSPAGRIQQTVESAQSQRTLSSLHRLPP